MKIVIEREKKIVAAILPVWVTLDRVPAALEDYTSGKYEGQTVFTLNNGESKEIIVSDDAHDLSCVWVDSNTRRLRYSKKTVQIDGGEAQVDLTLKNKYSFFKGSFFELARK